MSQGLFPKIGTELDLNGPILSFTNNPVGVATTSGASVTLSGFATATFATTATPDNAGSISYQWYEVDVGALSDNTEFTGTGTTQLTISNLTTPTDNNRKFFLQADYNPAQGQTGNAINEPLQSGIGTITVIPNVQIVAQPPNVQVNTGVEATFNIDAGLTDTTFGGVTYQWLVNGNSVDDGTITDVIESSTTVSTNVERTFSSPGDINLIDATNVVLVVAGAAGGGGGSDANGSGGGGFDGRVGRFPYVDGTRTLSFKIGRKGDSGGSGNQDAGGRGGSSPYASGGNGGGAGQDGWSGGGGGGGGATAVYDSVKSGHTIVSAGGAGGGGGSWNSPSPGVSPNERGPGLGFGRVRDAMSNGTSSPDPGNSGATKNGDGGGGGGGGGGASPSNYGGAGNGGSAGQDNSSGGTPGNGGASGFDDNYASFNFDGYGNPGDGYVNIQYNGLSSVDTSVTRTTTISGSKGPELKIKSSHVGIQTVRCVVSSDILLNLPFDNSDTNSPVLSDVVNFITTDATDSNFINIEAIGDSTTAALSTINLSNGEHEFALSKGDPINGRFTNLYVFYSPDKDIDVEMDLYGGKGNDNDQNGHPGGEGGFSRIRFTILQNTEYVIAGLTETINTPSVYRKATLFACVGGGGDAGARGKGGFGGGIGIAGQSGSGRGGGEGGRAITEGTSNLVARFGSKYDGATLTGGLIDSDTQAPLPDGGDGIPCTKGVYWARQGIAPCSDVGPASGENFSLSDGSFVTNTSDTITRGYKAGYNAIQTAGGRVSDGGDGGNGITGGDGGDGGGGGGGSGYTDGSVTLIDSQLGGSEGDAKVILRVVPAAPEAVIFTQSRSSNENLQVVLTLESGTGPLTITLGSASGFSGTLPSTVTAQIQQGAIYNVSSTTNVDSSSLSDNTLTVSDTDSNPGSLSITPSKGKWESTTRYQFL